MAELDGIRYDVTGGGRAVVVPRLNIDWGRVDLGALTERFRVVVVAPRGFGPSARPGRYDGEQLLGDVRRVVDHLGIEAYATFGYSMNGVMAARLALADPRVSAVACGGFPLTADLADMGRRQRARTEAAREDAAAWDELVATYDPDAAIAFWDDVAGLPRGRLADLDRPVRAWWGDDDSVLTSLLDPGQDQGQLVRDLSSRGIVHDVLPGLDHDGALDRLDLVLPSIAAWLDDVSAL